MKRSIKDRSIKKQVKKQTPTNKEEDKKMLDEKQINLLALENAESYVKIELEKLGRVEIAVKAGKDATPELMKAKESLALDTFKRIYNDPVISQHTQVFTPKEPKNNFSGRGQVKDDEQIESFV